MDHGEDNLVFAILNPGTQFIVSCGFPPDSKLPFPPNISAAITPWLPPVGNMLAFLRCDYPLVESFIPVMRSEDDDTRIYLGYGWIKFANAIQAKMGSLLVFTYVDKLDFEVVVHNPSPISFSLNVSYEPNVAIPLALNAFSYAIEDPIRYSATSFTRKMTPLTQKQIDVSDTFASQVNLSGRKAVRITVENYRMTWAVEVKRVPYGSGFLFGEGWQHVYLFMGCTDGDDVKFSVCDSLSTAECLVVSVVIEPK